MVNNASITLTSQASLFDLAPLPVNGAMPVVLTVPLLPLSDPVTTGASNADT